MSAGDSALIVKFPLWKMCLSVQTMGLPLKYQVYCTEGIPNATQGSVVVMLDPAVVSLGFVIHSGFATEGKPDLRN